MKKQISLIALLLAIVMTLTSCNFIFGGFESESDYESSSESEESSVESLDDSSETTSDETTETEIEETFPEYPKNYYNDSFARPIEEIETMITVSDEDFSEAEVMLEEFESAGLAENAEYESVDAVYMEFEDKYFEINTQVSLCTVVYYYDMSNEAASERYLDTYGKFGDLYNAYIEVCKNLYENSPISEELFADWTEDEIQELFDYDPQIQELREEIEALQVELNEIPQQDYDYKDRAAVIYAQIVTKNNQLAKLNGYDNYYDYATVEVYGRDYGKEELKKFSNYIAKHFKGNLGKVENKFQTEYSKISELGNAMLVRFLYDPFNKQSKNYLDLYIKSYETGSTRAAFHHLFENRNFVISNNENSHPSAFQTYIHGEGWDTPLCFFGSSGQDTTTIVHEMGHYYASLHNENVNSYDLAETQSQANEMLLLAFLEDHMTEEVYRPLTAYTMYNYVLQTIVCVIIDEFEREVYALESVEGYGSEEFDAIMAKACEKFGGIGDINDNITDINMYWRQVATNNPVYYISYATSMIEALNIYSIAAEDQDAARKIYHDLCEKTTEEDTLLTAAKKIGLSSPFEEATIKEIINSILGQ